MAIESWNVRSPAGEPLPVEIQVADAAEGDDLRSCLGRHGLPASLVEAAGAWSVEVSSPAGTTAALLNDLLEALESWLPDHAEGVRIQVGEHRYTVRSK